MEQYWAGVLLVVEFLDGDNCSAHTHTCGWWLSILWDCRDKHWTTMRSAEYQCIGAEQSLSTGPLMLTSFLLLLSWSSTYCNCFGLQHDTFRNVSWTDFWVAFFFFLLSLNSKGLQQCSSVWENTGNPLLDSGSPWGLGTQAPYWLRKTFRFIYHIVSLLCQVVCSIFVPILWTRIYNQYAEWCCVMNLILMWVRMHAESPPECWLRGAMHSGIFISVFCSWHVYLSGGKAQQDRLTHWVWQKCPVLISVCLCPFSLARTSQSETGHIESFLPLGWDLWQMMQYEGSPNESGLCPEKVASKWCKQLKIIQRPLQVKSK